LDVAGRSEEALGVMAQALSIHRERFGPENLDVARDLAFQAAMEARTPRLAEAERDGREALRLFTAHPGAAPLDLARVRLCVAFARAEAGKREEADRELETAVTALRAEHRRDLNVGLLLDA